jgi:Holliday junction resolvase RusA-like endonuclease
MLTLYGEVYSKKNSKQIVYRKNKPIIIASRRYLENETSNLWQLKQVDCRLAWEKMTEGKQYPFRVEFKFYRKTARPFDYANLVQGISDELVIAKYLPDDNMNYFIPVFAEWEKSKEYPRVEIKIL